MNISSAYWVILHASADFIFQSFWTWNSLDPDQALLFVLWFCLGDFGLKCMQNVPADKIIANKALKYAMNHCYYIYQRKIIVEKVTLMAGNVFQISFHI